MGGGIIISTIYNNISSRRDDVGVAEYASGKGPRPSGSSVYELLVGDAEGAVCFRIRYQTVRL